MKEFYLDNKFGRVIIVSDSHFVTYDGVGGYSSLQRLECLRDSLLREPDVDAVIAAGDLTTRNCKRGTPLDIVRVWKLAVAEPLTAAGIPVFALNASHDTLTADEFFTVFGYEHDYAIINGDVTYICLDTYTGERDDTMQTTESDISDETLSDALEIIGRADVKAAFVVCHRPNGGANLTRLIGNERVTAVVAGHSHNNFVTNVCAEGVDADKKLLQTGHFSRGHTKCIHDGCGFKPFVPMMHGDGMTVSDRDGVTPIENFYRTGSPWQYRAVERTADGIESYMIFPEVTYAEFESDGITFPAFTQPYARGYGDRSYIKFPIK